MSNLGLEEGCKQKLAKVMNAKKENYTPSKALTGQTFGPWFLNFKCSSLLAVT